MVNTINYMKYMIPSDNNLLLCFQRATPLLYKLEVDGYHGCTIKIWHIIAIKLTESKRLDYRKFYDNSL